MRCYRFMRLFLRSEQEAEIPGILSGAAAGKGKEHWKRKIGERRQASRAGGGEGK